LPQTSNPTCAGHVATVYPGSPGSSPRGSGWRLTGTPGPDVIAGSSEADLLEGR
jgi:hypothetical protein